MSSRQRKLAALVVLLLFAAPCTLAQTVSEFIVKAPVADMHSAPTEDSDVVSQAILSSEVTALEIGGEWAKGGPWFVSEAELILSYRGRDGFTIDESSADL